MTEHIMSGLELARTKLHREQDTYLEHLIDYLKCHNTPQVIKNLEEVREVQFSVQNHKVLIDIEPKHTVYEFGTQSQWYNYVYQIVRQISQILDRHDGEIKEYVHLKITNYHFIFSREGAKVQHNRPKSYISKIEFMYLDDE